MPFPSRESAGVEGHKHRVQGRRGRPVAALAGGLDRPPPDGHGVARRHPRPWRTKALRSDDQVVPNSWAAALTLPSHSASRNARSASARSARKRLGCQPTGRWARRGLQWSAPDTSPARFLPPWSIPPGVELVGLAPEYDDVSSVTVRSARVVVGAVVMTIGVTADGG
jgi:hypothetical protein